MARALGVLALAGTYVLGVVVAVGVIGLRWHYLTDTVAGAAVGTGTVCGLAFLLDLSMIRRLLTQPAVDRSVNTVAPTRP